MNKLSVYRASVEAGMHRVFDGEPLETDYLNVVEVREALERARLEGIEQGRREEAERLAASIPSQG